MYTSKERQVTWINKHQQLPVPRFSLGSWYPVSWPSCLYVRRPDSSCMWWVLTRRQYQTGYTSQGQAPTSDAPSHPSHNRRLSAVFNLFNFKEITQHSKLQVVMIIHVWHKNDCRWHPVLLYKYQLIQSANKCFGSRSFAVVTPTIWSSLPLAICSSVSFHSFRRQLKTFFYYLAFLLS